MQGRKLLADSRPGSRFVLFVLYLGLYLSYCGSAVNSATLGTWLGWPCRPPPIKSQCGKLASARRLGGATLPPRHSHFSTLPLHSIIMSQIEGGGHGLETDDAMGADNDDDLKLFVRRKTAKDLFFLDRGFRPDGSRLGALRPDPSEERDPGTLCSTAVRVIVCLVALLRSLTRCRTIDRVFGYSFRPTPLQYEVGSTASTNLSPYSTRAHTRSVRRNQATR